MTVVLIDNYDSFTYNLYQGLQAQTAPGAVRVVRNDELTFDELLTLRPTHVILSPGPGHPKSDRDFGICRDVVRHHETLGCPILGVCLGYQGIVHHLGGQVVPAPTIVHGKTSTIRVIADDPLFDGLPNPLTVMRYHSWMIDRASLPDELVITAETETDTPMPMAIRHRSSPLHGVQFHPESIGTPEGVRMLANFMALRGPKAVNAPERSLSA